MMTDDEAFARLGEVMAQVGNPWPRCGCDDIMLDMLIYNTLGIMPQPAWRGYEWYSSLTHNSGHATYAPSQTLKGH